SFDAGFFEAEGCAADASAPAAAQSACRSGCQGAATDDAFDGATAGAFAGDDAKVSGAPGAFQADRFAGAQKSHGRAATGDADQRRSEKDRAGEAEHEADGRA